MTKVLTKSFDALAGELDLDGTWVSATYEGASFDVQDRRLKTATFAIIPVIAPLLINGVTVDAFQFSQQMMAPIIATVVPSEIVGAAIGVGLMAWNLARYSISEQHIYRQQPDRAIFSAGKRLLKKERKTMARPGFGDKKSQNPVLTSN